MSRATEELLNRANALESDTLDEAIIALEKLGDEANGNDEEFKTLLSMVTELEQKKADAEAEALKEENKGVKLTGTKKFKKLQKSPFALGMTTFSEDEFEVDLTALKKQNPKFIAQIKRAVELKHIKVA